MPRERTEEKGCPRCGGKSGWKRDVRVTGVRVEFGAWGSDDNTFVDNDGERYRVPKSVVCEDCGKKVKVSEHDQEPADAP